ncbi:luciferin sulfotransferase-like [Pollicipes pollicipes]|uniref:luciferin sulfotransferase-like n=1 Tax=Pollicipes pollicipes TaxID=41117 RepID=UPI0018849C0B|nr:luciferin sulfotransferase-like [Pollicipes pollicipes]
MSCSERKPFPFKIIPENSETQKMIADAFRGHPNGLSSCNQWGFKLSATVADAELEDLYNYPLDPSDVWVMSPPKCGTTWTQEMVWLIANDLDYEGAKTPLFPDRWAFPDLDVLSDKEFLTKELTKRLPDFTGGKPTMLYNAIRDPPRFVKCHLPFSMSNPHLLDVCKVVYTARNPKDACVSYYNHNRLVRLLDFTGDLEMFVDLFMRDLVVETPFIEHMIEAWNRRHHPNLCFLFFEDMKRDLPKQIRKVAQFLGKTCTDEQVEKLASHLHIDNFRKNQFVNNHLAKKLGFFHPDRGDFIRQGKTGNWKNYFTSEMTETFDSWMAEKLKGSDLTFVTELDEQD